MAPFSLPGKPGSPHLAGAKAIKDALSRQGMIGHVVMPRSLHPAVGDSPMPGMMCFLSTYAQTSVVSQCDAFGVSGCPGRVAF